MKPLTLKVEPRSITGKKVKTIREKGGIPAVMYGQETDPVNLSVDYASFEKVYKKAGESTLVNLIFGDEKKEVPVLIHDVSYNPVNDKIEHIDFYKIKYGQELTANVELKFVGESKAVKEKGGILVIKLNEVEIRCLPKDLISEIEVDLSILEDFDDIIYVKDLKVPETIKIINDKEEIVAGVSHSTGTVEEESKEETEEVEEEKSKEKEPQEKGETKESSEEKNK